SLNHRYRKGFYSLFKTLQQNRMNIIQQYELKYITFDQLSEEIWGYGQRLINEVGVERFSFYVEAAAGYHNFRFYIFPLYI
ncbi:hypothetical protein SMG_01318, partial [Enterococcus faecium EnGen0180]